MEPGYRLPFVTVLVPCRNEADFIERCLTSILSNGYPADRLGVLVVDGRSEDGTRSVLGAYAQRHACVRVIDNPGRTTPKPSISVCAKHRGTWSSVWMRMRAWSGATSGGASRRCTSIMPMWPAA